MKTLKIIGLVVGGLLVVLLGVSYLLPRHAYVKRSAVMKAPAGVIHGQINNFKNWAGWSPWEKKDPNMKRTFSGPIDGVGATYSWDGDPKEVGTGTMVITMSTPDTIRYTMQFGDGGKAVSDMILTPQGDSTRVTWTLDSDLGMNPMWRWFGLFFEGMITPDYDAGLANLTKLAESLPALNLTISEADMQPVPVMTVRRTIKPAEIGTALGPMYGEIGAAMKKQGLTQAGAPSAVYHAFDTSKVDMEAAIPTDKPGKTDGKIEAKTLFGGTVVVADYFGKYEKLEEVHHAIDAYLKSHNKTIVGPPWEHYMTDPQVEKDPAKWHTRICYPVGK